MKTHILVRTVILALLASAATNAQTPTETPSATASATPKDKGACNHSSWNPELYTFYGAKDTIVEKLDKIPAALPERRVFVQVTQGDKGAQIKLFERQNKGSDKMAVTVWADEHDPNLLGDINRAIMANQGKECIGEVVKSYLVNQLGNGDTTQTEVSESPKDAFSPSVDAAEGTFMQTTIIILC